MAGLEVRNAQGALEVDLSARMTRIMGSVRVVMGQAGSVVVPDAGTGDIWFTYLPDSPTWGWLTFQPTISLSGNTIQWTSFNRPGSVGGVIRYGRF